MTALGQFHFLRPEWLWLLIPATLLAWGLLRRDTHQAAWRQAMAPHLLSALQVEPGHGANRARTVVMLGLAWLTAILALAGPSWQRESTPFSEDQSALVIVLRVAPEMLARDIQPNRLQRAIHKIHDLLELRPGTRNALVAYAGSAHLVMPLTSDPEVINSFAAGLDPAIMPREGDAVVEALAMADSLLRRAGVPGSIVLMTDAVEAAATASLERASEFNVHLLAIAGGPEVVPPADGPPAPPLDEPALRATARALGGSLTTVSADSADVQRLASRLERSFANAPPAQGERWRDDGWWLLLLLACWMLPFFRTGGAVVLE